MRRNVRKILRVVTLCVTVGTLVCVSAVAFLLRPDDPRESPALNWGLEAVWRETGLEVSLSNLDVFQQLHITSFAIPVAI